MGYPLKVTPIIDVAFQQLGVLESNYEETSDQSNPEPPGLK